MAPVPIPVPPSVNSVKSRLELTTLSPVGTLGKSTSIVAAPWFTSPELVTFAMTVAFRAGAPVTQLSTTAPVPNEPVIQ